MLPETLDLVSYNIQVAAGIRRYREYVTRGWRHLLPFRQRQANLDAIAAMLRDYDIVSLQEIDAGSWRGDFLNQAQYLADRAGFPHWHLQVNRPYGRLAQHGVALIGRQTPVALYEYPLPGMLGGRGALLGLYGEGSQQLAVFSVHLSLGALSRYSQLAFLADLAANYRYVVMMGDFNCRADQALNHPDIRRLGLHMAQETLHTFPSWRPKRNLDHILVSRNLEVIEARVLPHYSSDHLPLTVRIRLPEAVRGK